MTKVERIAARIADRRFRRARPRAGGRVLGPGVRGWIYLIEAVGLGMVKIGWTQDDPNRRMADLQVGCPAELWLRGAFAGTQGDERALHQKLAAHHYRGEWFHLAGEVDLLADTLERRCFELDVVRTRIVARALMGAS